jgi:hypothetical protein
MISYEEVSHKWLCCQKGFEFYRGRSPKEGGSVGAEIFVRFRHFTGLKAASNEKVTPIDQSSERRHRDVSYNPWDLQQVELCQSAIFWHGEGIYLNTTNKLPSRPSTQAGVSWRHEGCSPSRCRLVVVVVVD